MKKVVLLAAAATLLASGCTTRMGDYTLMSTKNVDTSDIEQYTLSTERCIGKDSKIDILGIPFGTPNLEEAADRAIENCVSGGVALTDVTTEFNYWHVVLFGQRSYVVEGNVMHR